MVPTLEERYIAKSQTNIAFVWADHEGLVLESRGQWEKFGFHHVRRGSAIADCINVLLGIYPTKNLASSQVSLPLIEYAEQQYMELSLTEDEEGVLISARDVTQSGLLQQEVMQSRNQLAMANAALEMVADDHAQALAGLRRFHMLFEHEVRNAAQNIYASLELMRRREEGIESNPNFKAAHLSSAALTETINAALKVEKKLPWQSGGRLVPADLVRDLALEFGPLASMKSLQLKHEIGANTDDLIRLDPFRLRLILVNLLGNAIKYTSLGSVTLEVLVERREDAPEPSLALVFRVSDTGIGLDEDILERMAFEKAVEEDGPLAKSASLGLYICRYLARSLRGQLKVRRLNKAGTSIDLIFPNYVSLLDA